MDAIRSTSSNTLIFAVYFFFRVSKLYSFASSISQVKMRIVIIFIYRFKKKERKNLGLAIKDLSENICIENV